MMFSPGNCSDQEKHFQRAAHENAIFNFPFARKPGSIKLVFLFVCSIITEIVRSWFYN